MVLGTSNSRKKCNSDLHITICDAKLDRVSNYKYLGVNLDSGVSLRDNTNKIIGMVSAKLNRLSYLRKYINKIISLLIYKTAVLPLLEYANVTQPLLTKTLQKKLQRLQNRALRIIYHYHLPADTLEQLHLNARLMPVRQRADRHTLCLIYRRSRLPDQYPHKIIGNAATRSASKVRFDLPRPKLEKYKTFSMYQGVQLWDELTAVVQHSVTYDYFNLCIPKPANFLPYPVS